ncbi:MAG: BrnT family toxin [Gloeomargaritaceae cyanobacterium C42_A2020_066]|nr:BrnT family toxin [Gloeomargaritaceae cyanobacterium C42_A2020_066]
MNFEWDEYKNQSNLVKHGFDFADAFHIFKAPMLVEFDDNEEYGEERWIGIGLLSGRVVVIVYVEPDEGKVRVISLRKA